MNIMKDKKVILIGGVVLFVILLFSICINLFGKKENYLKEVSLKISEESVILELNSKYKYSSAVVYADGKMITDGIIVDDSELDTSKIGNYKVRYYYVYKDKEYEFYQDVRVIDNEAPIINLTEGDITILVGDDYIEPGYNATDNYDGDITKEVKVTDNIEKDASGEYQITYKIADSSGNEAIKIRKVTVKKPNKIVSTANEMNKIDTQKIVVTNYSNTIYQNKFNNKGIYIEGYVRNSNSSYKLNLVGKRNYSFKLNKINNNNYSGSIDLTNVSNGKYNLYIESVGRERLLNKLFYLDRIVRARAGNKLITFSYDSNGAVSLLVENFEYKYDIIIDVGHGGSDTGAANEYIYEKDMNLIVSNYEKCRYESMGLSVYLTRKNDNYGSGMGLDGLDPLSRRSYELGYYGAVSKVGYSNHHNSIGNPSRMGYEMLVPAGFSKSELALEKKIYDNIASIYSVNEEHMRFYTRNYDTDELMDKVNGEVYSFRDYYAIIRIPNELFNKKIVVYEGCYLSNRNDFNWYWQKGNWKKISEAKIKEYVNYLGVTYNSSNNNC